MLNIYRTNILEPTHHSVVTFCFISYVEVRWKSEKKYLSIYGLVRLQKQDLVWQCCFKPFKVYFQNTQLSGITGVFFLNSKPKFRFRNFYIYILHTKDFV